MEKLNLPSFEFKYGTRNGKITIWDTTRKKYLILTPEEWVRQHFVEYLIQVKQFPRTLFKIEAGLRVLKTFKRTDIVCYSNLGNPVLMVECKAPQIKITQQTFDQIARYNIPLKVPYLVVTNGLQHYCCQIDFANESYSFLREVPTYTEITDV